MMNIKLFVTLLSIISITASTYVVGADDDGKWEKKWEKLSSKWDKWDHISQTDRPVTMSGARYQMVIEGGTSLVGAAVVQGNSNHVSVTTETSPEQKLVSAIVQGDANHVRVTTESSPEQRLATAIMNDDAYVASSPDHELVAAVVQGEHLDVAMEVSPEHRLVAAIVQGDSNHVHVATEDSSGQRLVAAVVQDDANHGK